jgi:hypothetical protein
MSLHARCLSKVRATQARRPGPHRASSAVRMCAPEEDLILYLRKNNTKINKAFFFKKNALQTHMYMSYTYIITYNTETHLVLLRVLSKHFQRPGTQVKPPGLSRTAVPSLRPVIVCAHTEIFTKTPPCHRTTARASRPAPLSGRPLL